MILSGHFIYLFLKEANQVQKNTGHFTVNDLGNLFYGEKKQSTLSI